MNKCSGDSPVLGIMGTFSLAAMMERGGEERVGSI
jgi:hypothetical protein